MATTKEQVEKILNLIPFTPTSQGKLSMALKGEVSEQDLFLTLSGMVQDGLVQLNMGVKGPEYFRKWDSNIDVERKALSKELNTRFDESVIFYPRFDGYTANLRDNLLLKDLNEIEASYQDISEEYSMWHRNAKSGVVYPPKLHAINSSNVLGLNIIAGLGVDPSQVDYAIEFEALASEQMHDRPNEISSPKAFFEALIHYDDSVDFVQTKFLEQFYQPTRPSLWAYQYGDRFLFDNEESAELIRNFAKKLHTVYFDSTDLMKTIVAVYSDILASPEEYNNKKVNLIQICFSLSEDTKFKLLKNCLDKYVAEARTLEQEVNELLSKLALPEGVSIEYQFLLVDDVVNNLTEEAQEYIKKRYIGF